MVGLATSRIIPESRAEAGLTYGYPWLSGLVKLNQSKKLNCLVFPKSPTLLMVVVV